MCLPLFYWIQRESQLVIEYVKKSESLTCFVCAHAIEESLYLGIFECFLNNVVGIRVLQKTLKVRNRKQFLDNPCSSLYNIYEALFDHMAAKFLCREDYIVPFELWSKFGHSTWNLQLYNVLNNIISAKQWLRVCYLDV